MSRSRTKSCSVYSALSLTSQKRIAAAEAKEALMKMEQEMNLAIDKKREELSCLERASRKAQRNISQYAEIDRETMAENDKIAYRNFVNERDSADEEALATQADIRRLEETLARRKEDIVKSLEATNEKIDVIAEEEEDFLGSGDDSQTSNKSTVKKVRKWLTTVETASDDTVTMPGEIAQARGSNHDQSIPSPSWKRVELDGDVIREKVVNPANAKDVKSDCLLRYEKVVASDNNLLTYAYNTGMGTAQPDFRNVNWRQPPQFEMKREMEPPMKVPFQTGIQPRLQEGHFGATYEMPATNHAPWSTQPNIGTEFVSQLATALSQAFGHQTPARDTREVIVKTPMDKDLPIYFGNPGEFCNFKAAFERSTKKFKFDEDENMARLHKALKGEAKKKVSHLMANPLNLKKLMETLEDCFGRPEFVLDYLVEKAKSCDRVEPNKPETLVAFGDAVEALVTNICSYNKTDYMNNKQLTKELVDKLPGPMKSRWYEWRAEDDNRETNLVYFSNWIKLKVKAARLQITPKVSSTTENEEKAARSRSTKRGPATVTVASTEKGKLFCYECSRSGHTIDECRKFARKPNKEKWDVVKEKKLCFLCLHQGHRTTDCKAGIKCDVAGCDKNHHSVLHYSGVKDKTKVREKPHISSESESDEDHRPHSNSNPKTTDGGDMMSTTTTGAAVVEGTDGALPIVPVLLKGPKGTVKTYALLDTGASRSLLEEELATELGLNGDEFSFTCRGFGGNLTTQHTSKTVEVDISGYYRGAKFSTIDNVITVERIGIAPYTINMKEARNKWPCLRQIKGRSMTAVVPRIIIGSTHRHLTIPRKILCSSLSGPVATRTMLGWVLEGNLNGNGNGTMYYLNACSSELDVTLHNMIKESFKNEDFGIKPLPSRHSLEDKKALQIMESTTRKIDNRWTTGLLWRDENLKLPDSYGDALVRLCATERKMKRDDLFNKLYMTKIEEYRSKGFIRKLSTSEACAEDDRTFYIPHFGVTNPNKPGKFRLVFDAAAKSNGVSLNDCLLTGPDLLRSLTTVLWNFRRHRVVISGDIEDMFHRVMIQEKDRSSQRFLWRDGDTTKAPDVYEMIVMIFGATSSPSSAIFVKNKNAEQHKLNYPEACRAIEEDFYVDDCLTGADQEEDAIRLRENITYVNKQGGFHIKKWISNSKAVMESIPVELRLEGGRNLSGISTAGETEERVLGLWWDPIGDFFTFKTNFHKVNPEILTGKLPTKRQICSLVMSLYDPLGFIGHYRVKGMIILQHVWNSGIGWDDEVPEEIYEEWLVWVGEINLITHVKIPRCYCVDSKKAVDVELHTFTDASKEAYAAVCFFRFIFEDHVNVSFISSKVKVAPLKKLTVPRLELQAAVLGAKLANTIANEIKMKITKRFFWSDSRTVLSWIRSESARQPEFIGNRIGLIQETTDPCDWRWVPTEENVADDATRISKETDFSPNSRWYTGPYFLLQDSSEWPSENKKDSETLVEMVSFSDVFGVTASIDEGRGLRTGEEEMVISLIKKFSSYTRLLRVATAVLRVSKRWLAKTRLRHHETNEKNNCIPLYIDDKGAKLCTATTEEIAEAEKYLIKAVQRQEFLCNGVLRKDKKMRQLSPYFDEEGLLRARGRIDNSKVSLDTRRPIILPAHHHLTDLIVECEHRRNAHTGQDTVLNNLRKKFWILDGRQAIRRCWTRCNHCRLQRVKPVIPEMGMLPTCRLDSGHPPFTYTGIDYYGPIEVTVGRRHEKRWGVLLCCMVTRAIHIEIAHGLSADETLLALSRFIDTRRRPHTIFSDNGTNFHGAIKELERAISCEKYKKIMEESGIEKIRWSFIPPAAAHMGGAWERLIQAVKRVLKNALHERFPRDTVLLTAMKAAENIVNSRPLTYLSADVEDLSPLTPNHFIKGEIDVGPSIPSEVETRASFFRQKWKEAQAIANLIWERWTKEYLPTLLRREKWIEQVEPLDVGDLVLIVDDQLPRNLWVKAVVTATYPGKDKHVRAVEVTTRNFATKKKTSLKRPVTKLCPLGLKMEKSAVMTSNLGAGNVGK